jgi:hypothetical protein
MVAKKRLELEHKTFDSLSVLMLEAVHPKHGTMWRCKCKCGNDCTVRGSHLTAGTVTRCSECKRIASRNPNGVGEMAIHYWNQMLRGAKERNLVVNVSQEYAYQKFLEQNRLCALTKVPICFPPRTNRPDLSTASLDRRDSSIGYTADNIQWVHKTVNRLKMNLSESELLDWCRKIVETHDTSRSAKETTDQPAQLCCRQLCLFDNHG